MVSLRVGWGLQFDVFLCNREVDGLVFSNGSWLLKVKRCMINLL